MAGFRLALQKRELLPLSSRSCLRDLWPCTGMATPLRFLPARCERQSIDHLLQNCADELTDGPFVQMPEELSAHPEQFSQIQGLMELFLGRVEEALGPRWEAFSISFCISELILALSSFELAIIGSIRLSYFIPTRLAPLRSTFTSAVLFSSTFLRSAPFRTARLKSAPRSLIDSHMSDLSRSCS